MKRKRVFILLILSFISFFLFLIPFLLSQTNELSDIDRAYSCLEQKLGNNCGNTRSTAEAAFNLLAISYDSNLQSACISSLNEKKNGDCFGSTDSGSCNVKSTAIAMLALNNVKQNVDSNLDWLLSKRRSDTGLKWYLEIDATNKTQCKVNGVSFTINEDKKISGSNPGGLQKAYNNYWFEITDISKNYTISCDQNFISTLIYQKARSNVFYVSGDTHSAPAGDDTMEKINSYCFATSGSSCDYEGTLWAALALSKMGEDYSPYIPYISAFADENENKKFLPYAFLQILSYGDDYYLRLVEQQKSGKYWEVSGNRLYDTAIALLALNSFSVEEVENAKSYLFSIQEDNGCWQSDTSLILYALSPRSPSLTGSSGGSISECEDPAYGYHCVPVGACSLVNTLSNFYCSALSDTCCSVDQIEETCSQKLGTICSVGNRCSIGEVVALDTNSCCLDNCVPVEEEVNECEQAGYFCQDGCFDDQEERTAYNNQCQFGQICCGSVEKKPINWLLIIILIILIILVILAIVFRNQLRIWLFKRKNNFESKEGPKRVNQPPYPPSYPYFGRTPPPRTGQRQIIPRRSIQRAPPKRTEGTKDKDYEETMKKLKDITK